MMKREPTSKICKNFNDIKKLRLIYERFLDEEMNFKGINRTSSSVLFIKKFQSFQTERAVL